MPRFHRLQSWDWELRVLKRGLTERSGGEREVSGRKSVKREKL